MSEFPFTDLGPELVATFATPAPVYRVRRGASAVVDGFATPATPQRQRIAAVVYPATGKTLRALPEAKRYEETIKVISQVELRTAQEGAHYADVIEYQGKTYEVATLMDWSANANFYSALCTRTIPEA